MTSVGNVVNQQLDRTAQGAEKGLDDQRKRCVTSIGKVQGAGGHATMSDVARAAGVSIKSVSRVINNEPHVTPALREKVEAAIAALDYVPDPAARSLAGARSFTVGLLFDNPSPNYTIKVQAGAYRACIEAGYHLRIDTVDSLGEGALSLDAQLGGLVRNSRVDGFVVTPPLTDNHQVLDFLEAQGVNYVRIAPVTDPGRSPAVVIDDDAAASAVAQLLWDQGHRRFGLVNGPREHGAAVTRRKGYLERIAELGGDPIAEGWGGFTFAGGLKAGRDILAASPRPTAIFCANDDMAAGAMVAVAEAGLKVPLDVSVVGFDDSWVAGSVWPYLTTVHQPIETMAFAAVSILLQRPAERDPDALVLDWHIVERDSVAAPR